MEHYIFPDNLFANLATKSLPKAAGILACVWNTISLQVVWWCELTVPNLHCIHSYSRVTLQTLQRALRFFLVMFRVIHSSSPTELIPASSHHTLCLTQFCIHWMQKHIPVLNKNAGFPSTKSWIWACFCGCRKSKGWKKCLILLLVPLLPTENRSNCGTLLMDCLSY